MQELMRMLDELFKAMAEKSGDDDNEETMQDAGEFFRVKHACATVLADMRREIQSLERTLAALNAKREMLIAEHNALVDEVKAMEKESMNSDSTEPVQQAVPPSDDNPAANQQPEEEAHEDEAQGTEEQPETMLNLDGMSRLERLQFGLAHAIEVLSGSKMAFHFKAIKQLRLDLLVLSKTDDKPKDEHIAELESGLKHAVEVLSTSPNAANSKTMRQLWGDLIVVLKSEGDSQQ